MSTRDNPLRVLFIGVSDRGYKISFLQPYPGYTQRQVTVTLLVYLPNKYKRQPPPRGEVNYVRVFSFVKLFFPIDALFHGLRRYKQCPFDLIVADDPMASGLVGVWLKHRLKLPLLIRCHTQYFGHNRWLFEKPYYPLFYLLSRLLLPHADRVQAVSRSVADGLLTIGVSCSTIDICPDPARTAFFDGPVLPAHPFAGRLLFVGYLIKCKGLDTLLRAVRLLVDAGQSPSLTLVGMGPEHPALQQLAVRLGIDDRVNFTGHVPMDKLAPLYRENDLFVLPSRYEALGRVLIEAALCGLPIVATRIGGIPETVIEGETALLVPPDDPRALASAIARLFDDPERAKAMGEKGRRFVRERFNWDRIMDDTVALWRRTAERKVVENRKQAIDP